MCGRYNIVPNPQAWIDAFQVLSDPQNVHEHAPNYNVCPSVDVPVIRLEGGVRTLRLLRWGLLPAWSKENRTSYSTHNARAETVEKLSTFKMPFLRQRCLIPASGYYEWRQTTPKVPFNIRRKDGAPMAFAGLWEYWKGKGEVIESCTIIATEPNHLLQPIHDRMPAILLQKDFDLWLDPKIQDPVVLKPLLEPYSGNDLEAYAVSTLVNNPRNNSPELLLPIAA